MSLAIHPEVERRLAGLWRAYAISRRISRRIPDKRVRDQKAPRTAALGSLAIGRSVTIRGKPGETRDQMRRRALNAVSWQQRRWAARYTVRTESDGVRVTRIK